MFNPSIKQQQAIKLLSDDTTNFVGYGGAAFSGKSYLIANWLLCMSQMYPETYWGLGRKELTTLKKTTLLTLFKVFKECNVLPDVHYRYNQQLNVIDFLNGSKIFLIDLAYKPSDFYYTKLGGYELTGAAVDESVEVDYQAIQILFTRLGRKNNHKYGLKKKLLETFNPSKNHVYHRYYKPFKEGTLSPNIAFVPALPKDNPSPEVDDYIKDIVATGDKVTIERLINGNFDYDSDESTLYNYDAVLGLFENDHVEEGKRRYITADIALHGSDLLCFLVWKGWVCVEIKTLAKSDGKQIEDTLRDLKHKHKVQNRHISYDADGVGGFLGSYFNGAYAFHNGASPIKTGRQKQNYENLKTQCLYVMKDYIEDGEIYFKNVTALQKERMVLELSTVKRRDLDLDGKLKVIKKAEQKKLLNGKSPDYLDCVLQRMIFGGIKESRLSPLY